MLTGGHPNSLGRTVEVVDQVLAAPERFDELFACYASADEVVRLRTSNAMKRVEAENPALLVPYLDRFIAKIGALDQASAQWTLAQLFERLADKLTPDQRAEAVDIMKRNLVQSDDWIVLNQTMGTLADWARFDPDLAAWLAPHLARLSGDPRTSVSKTATKAQTVLGL